MTKDELITKQQLEIEELKKDFKENEKLRKEIRGMFYNIGQPLNDNILKMNNKQMRWCFDVMEKVDCINGL